jgi:hypothetical protein
MGFPNRAQATADRLNVHDTVPKQRIDFACRFGAISSAIAIRRRELA